MLLATIFPCVTYADECLFIKRSNELRKMTKELEKAYSARDVCDEEDGETCDSKDKLWEASLVLEHEVSEIVAAIEEGGAVLL